MFTSLEASASAVTIPYGAVLGPIVLSICINAFFYGFSVLQFIQYRTRLFRDNVLTQ